jgi:hypothetical protein
MSGEPKPMSELENRTGWRWAVDERSSEAESRLQRHELARIGKELRALYRDKVDEPLPDGLSRLVARIGHRG